MAYAKERFFSLSKKDILYVTLDPQRIEFPKALDCIVCTEVLEHVFNPEELVRKIHESLKSYGILVVSESFDYVEGFCTHLPQHKGKGGVGFLNELKKIGFVQIDTGFNIHPTIHLKK